MITSDTSPGPVRNRPRGKFGEFIASCKAREELVVQPRMGFPDAELMHRGLRAVHEASPRAVGTITLDSFTRTNQHDHAREALRSGEPLNGYPLVAQETSTTRRVCAFDPAVFPIQVRHGSAQPQQIFRSMLAAGLTATEGGPVSYCLPYSRLPLATAIESWRESCRILAAHPDPVHLESFGGCMLGQLCPPGLLVALSVLECLFAAEHGLRSVSASYAQQTDFNQDLDALAALRRLCTDHLDDVDSHIVLYTYMGVFPNSQGGAELLLKDSARLAKVGGAQRLIVKTVTEATRIPEICDNTHALKAADATAQKAQPRNLHGSATDNDVYREAKALIDATLSLGPDMATRLSEAFRLGILDVPYCVHEDNANRSRTAIDAQGRLQWANVGNMPITASTDLPEDTLNSGSLLDMLHHTQRHYDNAGTSSDSAM